MASSVVVRHLGLVLVSVVIVGCGGLEPPQSEDAGTLDAGARDAGARDAGARDAGPPALDAGARGDAGVDAGAPLDAGVRDAGPNHPPVVGAAIIQSRGTAYAGQLVELALGVTDEDGDRLTFTWSGPGTFFENGNPSAQRWFSPQLTSPATLTLSVSVTDGRSPAVTRSTTVDVTVPRFQDVHGNILATPVLQGGQCVGCHGTMGSFQISLNRTTAWQQLVGAPHHRGAACVNAGVPSMVVASDLQRSLLYRKMTSTQPGACGDGMPAGTSNVPAAPLQFIVTVGSWIQAGALND